MEQLRKTKVTEDNRQDFYRTVYPIQLDSREQLINLDEFKNKDCILIDCCGSHYKKFFNNKITVLESMFTVRDFGLDRQSFDKLIDTRNNDIKWPSLDLENPVLIFDRSVILKYRSKRNFQEHISAAAEKYKPSTIIVRTNLFFFDDSRLVDRFYNFATFKIKNYVVEKFLYDATKSELFLQLKKVSSIDP